VSLAVALLSQRTCMAEFSQTEKRRTILWWIFLVVSFCVMVWIFDHNPELFPSIKKWWNLLGARFFICFGGYLSLYPERHIAGWIRVYAIWNEILHLPRNNLFFPTDRKLYSRSLTRVIGLIAFIFGILFLIQG